MNELLSIILSVSRLVESIHDTLYELDQKDRPITDVEIAKLRAEEAKALRDWKNLSPETP